MFLRTSDTSALHEGRGLLLKKRYDKAASSLFNFDNKSTSFCRRREHRIHVSTHRNVQLNCRTQDDNKTK